MKQQTPAYELSFDRHPSYLHARIKAEHMNVETARAYLEQVALKALEFGVERILLERDVPAMLPDVDLFHTTKFFLDLIGGMRVAFVNPHAEIDDDMDFAVLIGTNRGADYKLFDNTAKAALWLELPI